MRNLTSKEMNNISGGFSSADIMGFLRGIFGSKDPAPSKPWVSPSGGTSTGYGKGDIFGMIIVGAAAAIAALAIGANAWLNSKK